MSAPSRPVLDVRIEPLEPLLFGDNRAARAGVDHMLVDADPSPLTIHGAVGRRMIDSSPGRWPAAILGPLQDDILRPETSVAELLGYCLDSEGGRLLFPRPLHLRCRRDVRGAVEVVDRLVPTELEGRWSAKSARLLDGAHIDSEIEGQLWVDDLALGEILAGGLPEAGVVETAALYRSESRPGIAIDNSTGLVREAHYFNRPYRRFAPSPLEPESAGIAFRAWLQTLEVPEPMPSSGIGFLGGDRRRARFEWSQGAAERTGVLRSCRHAVDQALEGSRGFVLYLLTPSVAAPEDPSIAATLEHLMPEMRSSEPLAWAVGKERRVSGWNVKTGQPREILALIPEGSMFFFDWPDHLSRREVVDRLWLTSVSSIGAAAGFGRVLVGVW